MKYFIFKVVSKAVILLGQTMMIVTAFFFAIYLRYDGSFTAGLVATVPFVLIPLIIIKLSSFAMMRLLSGWWRYVSIHDLVSLVKANVLGSLLFAAFLTWLPGGFDHITPSVIILDGLLCFLIMSGNRVIVRISREYYQSVCKSCSRETENVLIVGAGAAGQTIVREIRQNPHLKWKVIGFVDQDIKRVKQRFQGIQVLADINGLKSVLQKKSVDLVIMANPALGQKELRRIVRQCHDAGVKSKILPNVGEILNGQLSIQSVRDVRLDDLLGRCPVRLEVNRIHHYLGNKKVLVTGAAGSIGQEICRQVAGFGASTVILFESAETPLFQVERDLKKQFPHVEFIPRLSDVKNASQVDYVFRNFRPEVVFHAAAYKHVPMSELNPVSAIENNVIGSRNVVDAADRFRAEHFVMVSTDKAVNPTNIMGASKRAAEIYVQALARTSRTRIVTVRFGNVLGSNGSVVPIFQEQIRNGGPVTVTDPTATRFFMTIPEAVQLVLQAGSMGEGGEIFILEMGQQVKVLHLAEELIRLSGMTPYKDIDIEFTGLRPGEKLHEELLYENEGVLKTNHEKICVALACWHDPENLKRTLETLAKACDTMDRDQTISILMSIVPEFKPQWANKNEMIIRSRILKPRVIRFPSHAIDSA
ncbi:MAG: polysaccharide biosynthesis protein [Desulfuromonadales bacterium]|nr:polysaccharide biosynthesis protein [Desulfuromonadales bacterium]